VKAMILAAGRGERMRPLTDHCPKPLLKVADKPLIEHHINNLVANGITDIVINLAWLGEKIVDYLQDGHRFGANISYSRETSGALETAGGIIKALPLLTDDSNAPFLVVNGDIYCDYNFSCLPELAKHELAHIFLVDNPEHNLTGDFFISGGEVINPSSRGNSEQNNKSYTVSGIVLYRPEFFNASLSDEVARLATLLRNSADNQQLSGSILNCRWVDVGTPERLAQLNLLVEENK